MPQRLYLPFELALQEFYLAGGSEVSAIRAPPLILKEYLRLVPSTPVPRYMSFLVELAMPQKQVSVLGKRTTGQLLEAPTSIK